MTTDEIYRALTDREEDLEAGAILTASCSCPEVHNPFPTGTAPSDGSSDHCANIPGFTCPSCGFAHSATQQRAIVTDKKERR